MALSDNMRLYDIATRQALFVEGVKAGQFAAFNEDLYALREELRKILYKVKYKNLDGLSKLELNRLIANLRAAQSRVYSAYTIKLIQQLQDFMQADLVVSRRAYAMAHLELDGDTDRRVISDAEAIEAIKEQQRSTSIIPLFGFAAALGDGEAIWSKVINAPIPANGLYILPFINGFTVSAMAGVENIIRKSWANKLTLEETVDAIASSDGETTQGTKDQMSRVGVQAAAVIATATAHVAAIAAGAVASTFFDAYQWVSVMDNRTTDVCIFRNLKRYRYGFGPLPPAHVHCRSHIVPSVGIAVIPEESLYTWFGRQPGDVQDFLVGETNAAAIRSGKVKAKDFPAYYRVQPLTLKEFRRSVVTMLSRAA